MKTPPRVFAIVLGLLAAGAADAQITFSLTDLGTLGGTSSIAFSINGAGTVVGNSPPVGGSPVHAFSYTSGGGLVDLGTLGGSTSDAHAIKSSGNIVGQSDTAGGVKHAFRLTSGVLGGAGSTDLGTLGGTASQAWDINASGQIVGQSQITGDGAVHAFLLDSGTLSSGNSLGTLAGGTNSYAYALNDAGVVIGESEFAGSGSVRHAFSYNGSFTDLGTLGGSASVARDINSASFIVGAAQISGGAQHAFFYDGTTMYDLNDYVTGAGGWVLVEARGINDANQIVGYGINSGQIHAFSLTVNTVPEPATYAALFGVAALGLALFRRRHPVV